MLEALWLPGIAFSSAVFSSRPPAIKLELCGKASFGLFLKSMTVLLGDISVAAAAAALASLTAVGGGEEGEVPSDIDGGRVAALDLTGSDMDGLGWVGGGGLPPPPPLPAALMFCTAWATWETGGCCVDCSVPSVSFTESSISILIFSTGE